MKKGKRNLRRLTGCGLVAVLLLSAFLGTGCSDGVLGTEELGPSEMRVDTELCLPMDRVRTWNPLLSTDEDVYYVEKMIYEGLFRLDEQLAAEPVLAESWSFDETGTNLTVRLRSGVLWHDGEALTAKDVKFTVEAFQKANASLYKDQADLIRSVKVTDDHTAVITFVSADNSSLEKLTFPILPEHQYKNISAWMKASENFTPVGTGRYCVDSLKEGDEISLKANSAYYGSPKASNTVTFKVTSENANPVNLFAISDLNLVFLRDINRETMYSNRDVDIMNFPSDEAEILGFNTTHPLLSQKKFRQAIAYAVDVTKLLDHIYYNNGILSDSLYYPGYLGMENTGDPYRCSADTARKLLRELGYSDADGGMFRDGSGSMLSLTLTVNRDSQMRLDAAELIQAQLLAAGIDCQINAMDWDTYQASIAQRSYDLFLGGYRFNEAYDLRFLLHSAYNNPAGYANGRADELLTAMETGGVGAEQKKDACESLRKILQDDLPYYCMFYRTYGRLAAWELSSEEEPLFCDLYRGAESWRLIKSVNVVDSAE